MKKEKVKLDEIISVIESYRDTIYDNFDNMNKYIIKDETKKNIIDEFLDDYTYDKEYYNKYEMESDIDDRIREYADSKVDIYYTDLDEYNDSDAMNDVINQGLYSLDSRDGYDVYTHKQIAQFYSYENCLLEELEGIQNYLTLNYKLDELAKVNSDIEIEVDKYGYEDIQLCQAEFDDCLDFIDDVIREIENKDIQIKRALK